MVFRLREADILSMAGADAVVFLAFVRLVAISLTFVAIPLCLVLLPIDLTYNLQNENQKQSDAKGAVTTDSMYVTMGGMQGPKQWAHVVVSYLVVAVVLSLVQKTYLRVTQIRQEYFASKGYQSNFQSRTLLITDISTTIGNDEMLRQALQNSGSPYPFKDVELGMCMNDLARLLRDHKDAVYQLEKYIDKALRHPHKKRPTVKVPNVSNGPGSKREVDAIDYFDQCRVRLEHEIEKARNLKHFFVPQTYGFASTSHPMYAHAAAKYYNLNRPSLFQVRMASSPRDIIWENLEKSRSSRRRSRHFGNFLLLLLFLGNIIPLLFVAILSNLDAFGSLSPTLKDWHSNSEASFAAVTGVVPPLVAFAFSLVLPRMMRKLVMYRGVRTKQSRDVTLTGQYFTFLILTQFLIFSLISVLLDLTLNIMSSVGKDESASSVLASAAKNLSSSISLRFQFLSAYWMTWVVLRGFLLLVELAQISRLFYLWVNEYILPHTPRDLWLFSQPPPFYYWSWYAELLFLAAIGLIYAPLSPIVTAFTAGVFWLALFVFKNQLFFVYVTKRESGGRLWNVVVRCLLVALCVMQAVLAASMGLVYNWIKAVVCLPPILAVLCYGFYAHWKLDPQYLWFTPTPMELARLPPTSGMAVHEPLRRQFGHPLLYDKLSKPIINSVFMNRVTEVYGGEVVSCDSSAQNDTPATLAGVQTVKLQVPTSSTESGFSSQETVGTNAEIHEKEPLAVYDELDLITEEYGMNQRKDSISIPLSELDMGSEHAHPSKSTFNDSQETFLFHGQPTFAEVTVPLMPFPEATPQERHDLNATSEDSHNVSPSLPVEPDERDDYIALYMNS